MKFGDYEVEIKKGDKVLDSVPDDLPVIDFEGNTITMKEAKDGYMRTKDYTQKTQKIAAVQKFLTDELGFQDDVQGVHVMRKVLESLSDLEEKGLYDSKTGEFKIPENKSTSNPPGNVGGDADFVLGMEHLPKEVQHNLKTISRLEKDMGSLMGYLTRKEIHDIHKDLSNEEVEMQIKLAALDPSRTPMEHANLYVERKKEWGQKAVDAYVEALKKPKDEGHDRPGSGEPALEIFGEKPVFSFTPGEHVAGTNIVNPSDAANKYLEAIFEGKTGE